MKLILREYLASLKERRELDAILPDLLSELGYHVYSRPLIGTTQHGVDIAAIGEECGQKKVFLFSVKQGDLTRQDWDGPTNQSLRPSLNQIRDVYIRTKVPDRYKDLKVVVCLCFGGDIQENVRLEVEGYIADNTTERVSYQEWNGDKLAELLMAGILREKLLPASRQQEFRKAVAMVDQPDVAFHHFGRFVRSLRDAATPKARVSAARQIYIAVWVLFAWAREAGTLEAPYRASELAILAVWDLHRPDHGQKPSRFSKAVLEVFEQLVHVHLTITEAFLVVKVFPLVDKPNAVAASLRSQSPVDVGLALFDLLGRIAMMAAWLEWKGGRSGGQPAEIVAVLTRLQQTGLALITNNTALNSPLHDAQAIDITLFLLLAPKTGAYHRELAEWLDRIIDRLRYSIRSHGRYPIVSSDYGDLIAHPRERTDDYRKEATAGSTLIPLVGAWASALGLDEGMADLGQLMTQELAHCTLQLWIPDATSEASLYLDRDIHGLAITGLPATGADLLRRLAEAVRTETSFENLSAMVEGCWPVVLLACRHHGLPIPPQFWIHSLSSEPA